MPTPPACPVCTQETTYQDADLFICPDCAHEWSTVAQEPEDDERIVLDSNNNPLVDGDAVYLIKDLRVKGSSTILKKGTKIRSIRIIPGDHEIDCKVDGISYQLKAEFMKKG